MTREEAIEEMSSFEITREKIEKFIDYLPKINININDWDDVCCLLALCKNDIKSIAENVGIPVGFIRERDFFVFTVYDENGDKIINIELDDFYIDDELQEQGYTVDGISKIIGEKFNTTNSLCAAEQLTVFVEEFCKNGIVIYN